MMAAEGKKSRSPRSMSSETQEEELLDRIDRLETTLETLMKAITDDNYREHWEKKTQKRMKARILGHEPIGRVHPRSRMTQSG